jgi:hypothetical protein
MYIQKTKALIGCVKQLCFYLPSNKSSMLESLHIVAFPIKMTSFDNTMKKNPNIMSLE